MNKNTYNWICLNYHFFSPRYVALRQGRQFRDGHLLGFAFCAAPPDCSDGRSQSPPNLTFNLPFLSAVIGKTRR